MTNIFVAGDKSARTHGDFATKLVAALALAAIGDWLFYDRPIGVSLALFIGLTAIAVLVANPEHIDRRQLLRALLLLLLGILPMVLQLNAISFLVGAAGLSLFAVTAGKRPQTSIVQTLLNSLFLALNCGWRVFLDAYRATRWWLARKQTRRRVGSLTVWIVPVTLGAVFFLLFVDANPVIAGWLATINLSAIASHLIPERIVLWLFVLSLVWPFLTARLPADSKIEAAISRIAGTDPLPLKRVDRLLGRDAILRALILFNILFALQTTLDFAYLWGGVSLPDGMTYATYAHRGAYPLVATALLAAAFVFVALKPGSKSERSPIIRALVFAWIGQNILLVASSILRLNLYVEAYSLTLWRFAAFIWMLLVAIGLALIIARIAYGRSNHWLIAMNGAALALALYVTCFINVPLTIANYNVAHSRESSGQGISVDVDYLLALGSHAIPAIDRYLDQLNDQERDSWGALPPTLPSLVARRNLLARAHLNRMGDWRAYGYRDWQLARYLQSRATPELFVN